MMNILEKIAGLYRPGLFKFLLFPFLILVNFGMLQGIHHMMLISDIDMPREECEEKSRIVMDSIQGLIIEAKERAESNGGYCSPDDYYRILGEIYKKETELGFHNSGEPELTIYAMELPVHDLFNSMDKGIRKGVFSHDDIEIAIKNYEKVCDPNGYDKEVTIEWLSISNRAIHWTWIQYLLNMPIALMYFLIWFRDEQEELKYKGIKIGFRNPFRFALMLLFYPIVLGYVFYRWTRTKGERLVLEAQLRRAKSNIFQNLTRDELAFLERFLREKKPLSLWKSVLSARGLTPRHSFSTAMAATLVLMVLNTLMINPRVCEAGSRVSEHSVLEQSLGGNLARMHIGDEGDGDGIGDSGGIFSHFRQCKKA